MHYNGEIRIQSSIDVKHLKEVSYTMDYLNIQPKFNELTNGINETVKVLTSVYNQSIMASFSNLGILLKNSINDVFAINLYDMSQINKNIKNSFADFTETIQKTISNSLCFKGIQELSEKCLFLRIADEIGFPVYLEVDSELQERLLYSYKQNENQCNKKEMSEIILDYYNDDYVDHIMNGIKNVRVFNPERVILIEEGIETYQLGLYGSSASLFAAQLSGMIRDIYEELNTFHRITYKEKKELIVEFNQNCRPDSEKGMLLQIVNSQSRGGMIWYKVLRHFLDIVYSSKGHKMAIQPQRHMICHGKQTNYNTKEMNMKLIFCMDIIAELAWRVKQMKEVYSEVVIDV